MKKRLIRKAYKFDGDKFFEKIVSDTYKLMKEDSSYKDKLSTGEDINDLIYYAVVDVLDKYMDDHEDEFELYLKEHNLSQNEFKGEVVTEVYFRYFR
jgi:transposase-like protein